ncbi:MAG: PHP domain-containing protein [Nitrospirae bacterium]|nr:MAG: PHP domain-containing protein [Nitrospirota bacterium]
MNFRIDLHVHSRSSGDNNADPEETVSEAILKKLDGIAFTEHYSYGASEHAERLQEKYRDVIRIFRGVEFSALEGHCLVFGVDTDKLLPKHAPIAEVIKNVNSSGGVVIPSHPYRRVNSIDDMVFKLSGICAIEGYNGCNMHAYNLKAVEAAKQIGCRFTGGSDAHLPSEIGSCYTEFYEEVTHENLVSLLKSGAYTGKDTRKISKTTIDYMNKWFM